MLLYLGDCNLILKKKPASRFARKKSSIERLGAAQFESYYISGVGFTFVDSCKDLGKLVDTEI